MVYVQGSFFNTAHGKMSCIHCHHGDETQFAKDAAHVNLVAYPSSDPEKYCGSCHSGPVSNSGTSLHQTQNGYYHLFEKRAGFDLRTDSYLTGEFDKECGKCHTTCGQCHVSRPVSVNGGFIAGHVFNRTPSMTNNCTACHGSRIGAEYLGENAGYRADVHWLPNAKRCEFCHDAGEMHGSGELFETRYDARNTAMPRCEDCHEDARTANVYHQRHWADAENDPNVSRLACQVCHSQDYKNCNACHTGGAGITGSSYMTYKIGNNPIKSDRRPYDYAVVRHIPVAPNTFEAWGVAALSQYDSEPTWKYASPHNILRWTARTDTTGGGQCWSHCHNNWVGSLSTYLRDEDLQDYEKQANQTVLMPTN